MLIMIWMTTRSGPEELVSLVRHAERIAIFNLKDVEEKNQKYRWKEAGLACLRQALKIRMNRY